MLATLKTKKGAALALAAGALVYAGLGVVLGFHDIDQALAIVRTTLGPLLIGG
jgi:hypothetical protein